MSTSRDYSEEEIREMDKKEFRKEFPSGWMEVARNESVVLTIDALLESSPTREFTQEELSGKSGLSERSIDNHMDELVDLGIVERLEDRTNERYRLNSKSSIIKKIRELDSMVQRVKSGDVPKTISEPLSRGDGNHPHKEDNENPIDTHEVGNDDRPDFDDDFVNDDITETSDTFAPAAN